MRSKRLMSSTSTIAFGSLRAFLRMSTTTTGTMQLGQRDVRRQAAARDEVARNVHVRARVLAERPLLRVEAGRGVVGDRLTLGLLAGGEDREALRERVRQVAEAVLAAAAAVRERARREARGERDAGCAGRAEEGGAPVDLRRPVRLDSLPDDLGSARKTHGRLLSTGLNGRTVPRVAEAFKSTMQRPSRRVERDRDQRAVPVAGPDAPDLPNRSVAVESAPGDSSDLHGDARSRGRSRTR